MTAPAHRPRGRSTELAGRRAVEHLVAQLPEAGAIPRREGELAFDAPWELRALAMAVGLHEAGRFPWLDFQSRLAAAIRDWERGGHEDRDQWSYYRHWVRALERLVGERGLIGPGELERRAQELLTATPDPRHPSRDPRESRQDARLPAHDR